MLECQVGGVKCKRGQVPQACPSWHVPAEAAPQCAWWVVGELAGRKVHRPCGMSMRPANNCPHQNSTVLAEGQRRWAGHGSGQVGRVVVGHGPCQQKDEGPKVTNPRPAAGGQERRAWYAGTTAACVWCAVVMAGSRQARHTLNRSTRSVRAEKTSG